VRVLVTTDFTSSDFIENVASVEDHLIVNQPTLRGSKTSGTICGRKQKVKVVGDPIARSTLIPEVNPLNKLTAL
jgi:hypothetical protein